MTVTTANASSSADPPSDDSRTPQQQGSQSSTSGLANQFVGDTGNKGSGNVAGQNGSQTYVAGSTGQGTADPQRGHKLEGPVELDEFGLPVRKTHSRFVSQSSEESEVFHEAPEDISAVESEPAEKPVHQGGHAAGEQARSGKQDSLPGKTEAGPTASENKVQAERVTEKSSDTAVSNNEKEHAAGDQSQNTAGSGITAGSAPADSNAASKDKPLSLEQQSQTDAHNDTTKNKSLKDRARASEWSHQRLTEQEESDEEKQESEGEWRDMPALGEFDVYDDYGRIVARGSKQEDDEAVYRGLGGAGKGYTRVQLDEDAMSATSMDEDTSYLFKEGHTNSAGVDEELRDSVTQLQATKDLLTESQRIAYVGVARLTIYQMVKELQDIEPTKSSKKSLQGAADSMRKWGQQMMSRLYTHMDIDSAEQIMIEQLAEHGVQPADLVRPLMQNARVKNPMAESVASPKRPSSSTASPSSKANPRSSLSAETEKSSEPSSPPPYEDLNNEDLPEVRTPFQLPSSEKIDIDLRWTVLCDLFLVLVSDATYDARSRRLLERVGQAMEVPWVQICRFEKRVTDALEMQETVDEKEKWDETENMENRRKMALKKKYMIMGLATVGGGLVIGLSAGLLAPVIGAGLAAGFTTIGISGTSAFLSGAGGTALIAGGATLTGGTIGIRASHRRTGAVKTFEYRPLHNNKRVNLIVTVSGWMTGKVDDVRLPYSTVDPIMGDLYSVLWEPEMLQSMGATINILATEALTQGLQQVLGSTVLVALMASLQLPIVLTKLSYLIDNPWNVSLGRANAAGLILADSLMARNLGNRPVTLLGFSLGSRVIFSCLKELANKGAYGLVQNVYLFGSPIVANKDEYLKARSVVSGRFVNGYASNDWILGYLFRATSGGIMRVAGLAPVEGIPGLENIDVTNFVNGHMAYRAAMPRLLREVGWEVLNEEFAEIEDPDPDNHAERQRELIREIDEARREAELKPEKKRFGFFKRGKLAEKKVWETYDPKDMGRRDSTDSSGTGHGSVGSVLFDIDAIRAELASEQIEVKQLESTLPPMKLDLNSSSANQDSSTSKDVSSDPKQTKSADAEKSSNGQSSGTSGDKSPYDPYTVPGEEDIQMTFDTSYQAPSSSHHGYSASSPTFRKADEDFYSSPSSSQLRRPSAAFSIGSAAAAGGAAGVATSLSTLSLERNAWAEDEFGNGGEGEIQMTFE